MRGGSGDLEPGFNKVGSGYVWAAPPLAQPYSSAVNGELVGQQLKGWGDSSAERFLGAEVRGRLKAKDKPPPLPDALYLYDFFY